MVVEVWVKGEAEPVWSCLHEGAIAEPHRFVAESSCVGLAVVLV